MHHLLNNSKFKSGKLASTIRWVIIVALSTMPLLAALPAAADQKNSLTVVLPEDVKWGYLNPLRGDKSPGAANLWGDRTQNMATGMFVRFKKGFQSPPHIHNITYRGVVIKGLLHNDDPTAEKMWMPTGSYWTQPAGENHITAANAEENLIYLEIDSGPYLVKPKEQHFDNGEKPVNMHASNTQWLDHTQSTMIHSPHAELAYLWQNNGAAASTGYLLKLNKGFDGIIATQGADLKAVIIQGQLMHQGAKKSPNQSLPAGTYFSAEDDFKHIVQAQEDTLIYLRTSQPFNVL